MFVGILLEHPTIQELIATSNMEKISFQKHPSTLLNDFYNEKGYQGANPKDANILFVGRDPNWAIDVENMSLFNFVKEYLNDGINFWGTYNIHHPFLLPEYKGDGKRYHKMFSKLKLNSNFSSKISFVELIGFPTTGMAKKDNKSFKNYLISDKNKNHLIQLDTLMNDNDKKIFIAWGLIEDFKFLYKETGLFSKFANIDKSLMDINDLNQNGNIYIHRHFSDAISNATIAKISDKIIQDFNQNYPKLFEVKKK